MSALGQFTKLLRRRGAGTCRDKAQIRTFKIDSGVIGEGGQQAQSVRRFLGLTMIIEACRMLSECSGAGHMRRQREAKQLEHCLMNLRIMLMFSGLVGDRPDMQPGAVELGANLYAYWRYAAVTLIQVSSAAGLSVISALQTAALITKLRKLHSPAVEYIVDDAQSWMKCRSTQTATMVVADQGWASETLRILSTPSCG